MFLVKCVNGKLSLVDFTKGLVEISQGYDNMVQDRNHAILIEDQHIYEGKLIREFPQTKTTLPNGRKVLKSAIAYVKLVHKPDCQECLRLKEEAEYKRVDQERMDALQNLKPKLEALAQHGENLRAVADNGQCRIETSQFKRTPGWREELVEEFMEGKIRISIYKEVFYPHLEEEDSERYSARNEARAEYLSQYDD
jgi:hypothetical protein